MEKNPEILLHCFFSVTCGMGLKAGLEHTAGSLPTGSLDKRRLEAAGNGSAVFGQHAKHAGAKNLSGSALFRKGRQQDFHLGKLAVSAFKNKFAVMVGNDSMADGKTQACSYA